MKPVYAMILILSLSACGEKAPNPDQLATIVNPKYNLEGSYKLNPCPYNYPSEILLTDTQATLNYASQGESRAFDSIPRYLNVDGKYGLVGIVLQNPTGFCGIDYDDTCENPYTMLYVVSDFYEDIGALGFGKCTYRHE